MGCAGTAPVPDLVGRREVLGDSRPSWDLTCISWFPDEAGRLEMGLFGLSLLSGVGFGHCLADAFWAARSGHACIPWQGRAGRRRRAQGPPQVVGTAASAARSGLWSGVGAFSLAGSRGVGGSRCERG